MKVLLTGAEGLLGAAVAQEFGRHGTVDAAARRDLDITDADAVAARVAVSRPDVIINCAAYNDVDGAEDNAAHSLRVNAFGVLALAAAARACGATLVHYSTDFVFDGETSRPYVEDDRPNPRNVYAATKLLGEWFAADARRYYVLRVESLFGGPVTGDRARRGSLAAIIERVRGGDVVPVFVDRTVSPSYTPDVAAATRALLDRAGPWGTYHCVNDSSLTWRGVAEEIARQLGADLRVRELTLATSTARAPRPRYCALSPARLASMGITMPPWTDALARHLRQS